MGDTERKPFTTLPPRKFLLDHALSMDNVCNRRLFSFLVTVFINDFLPLIIHVALSRNLLSQLLFAISSARNYSASNTRCLSYFLGLN